MILDSNLILSDAQEAKTTAFSENVIDTIEVGDAVNELYFVAYVEDECTGTGSVEVQLVTSDTVPLADATSDVLWSSGAVPAADLADKYCFGMIRLPKPEKVKRYIGAKIVSANITGGALDIYLTDNPQTNF